METFAFFPEHVWVHQERSGLLHPTVSSLLWGMERHFDLQHDRFATPTASRGKFACEQANWERLLDSFDFERSVLLGGVHELHAFVEYRNKVYGDPFVLPPLDYPKELRQFLERDIVQASTADLFLYPALEDKRLFVKSVKHKLFSLHDVSLSSLVHSAIPQDVRFWISPMVDFVSEYRCYVYRGEMRAMRHYKGDWSVFPCPSTIKAMINAYQAAGDVPSAYGLDVGIERDGRTLLVEVNDALCLGNYGISPSLAASMFCARWRDIFLNPLAKK